MKVDPRRNRQLVVSLICIWVLITWYSASVVPDFWSSASIFTVGLGYSFYYAWSRISRGTGQAGIVIIERDSPASAKWSADLAMFVMGAVSLLVLLGHNDLLLKAIGR